MGTTNLFIDARFECLFLVFRHNFLSRFADIILSESGVSLAEIFKSHKKSSSIQDLEIGFGLQDSQVLGDSGAGRGVFVGLEASKFIAQQRPAKEPIVIPYALCFVSVC